MKKLGVSKANVLTKSKIEKIVSDDTISKSQRMKDLFDGGLTIKEIAVQMKVRYNFAYNVISNYAVTNELTIEKTVTVSKKDLIVELFNQGKSNKEISIELKTNYNYVFNVLKDYKAKQAKE